MCCMVFNKLDSLYCSTFAEMILPCFGIFFLIEMVDLVRVEATNVMMADVKITLK
jgi:hypothetical protein